MKAFGIPREWLSPLFLLVVLPGLLSRPAGAGESVTVPFSLGPRGHILVSVTLSDDVTRQFALDTAAGKCVISPEVARDLECEPLAGSAVVVGETGRGEFGTVRLDGVALGGRTLSGLPAVVQDLQGISQGRFTLDGILGAPFLREFDLRIDFPAGTVTLFDPATEADCPVCPAAAVPVGIEVRDQGHILVPAGIGETDLTGLLDTGSGHSGINSIAARDLEVELPDPPPSGHGFGILAGPIRVGDQVILDQGPLAVMDRPDIFSAFDLVNRPRILMGTNLFRGRVLSISYSTLRLWVE